MKGLAALCAALMLAGCMHQMALPSEEVFQACWKQAAAIYDPDDPMQAHGRYTVIGDCIQGKGTSLGAALR